MQIKRWTLLFLLLTGAGAAGTNLLPEWENAVTAKEKTLLPNWRFSDWGERPGGKVKSKRSFQISRRGPAAEVTLKNTAVRRSANLFFRTLPLKNSSPRTYLLRFKHANKMQKQALIKASLSSSGKRQIYTQNFFLSEKGSREESLKVTIPPENKRLTVTLALYGPGEVTFSDLSLTASVPEDPAKQLRVPRGIFSLPEKKAAEFPITLPAGVTLSENDALVVKLPWGIRFINSSPRSLLSQVELKVREHTILRITPQKKSTLRGTVHLLLGSDLPASDVQLTAEAHFEHKGAASTTVYPRFRVVKDLQAVPPRYFSMALTVLENVHPLDAVAAADYGLLRNGANILVTPRLRHAPSLLHNVRVSHWAQLTIPAARQQNHCLYASLRDESFWEKVFIPAVRRNLLRYGGKHIDGIICDAYLGQMRNLQCLCALCRAELADFAPRLPRRTVMNSSAGILRLRYPGELKAFRLSRLNALRAGAQLHLPAGGNGFYRSPRLIYMYDAFGSSAPLKKFNAAVSVLNFRQGPTLAGDKKYNGAAEFLSAETAYRSFRRKISSGRIIARFVPHAGNVTPGQFKFSLFNYIFAGANGVWTLLPSPDQEYHAAFAETSLLLRKYENFFRRSTVKKSPWVVKCSHPVLQLPPLPGPGSYPLDLPESFPPVKELVWQQGTKTLTALGNFSSEPLECRLTGPAVSLRSTGEINGEKVDGKTLRKGVVLTLPPESWSFFEFSGL